MDWLSRLLDIVPVSGQLDIHCTFGAPWRVDHAPAAMGEIQYHVIVSGTAMLAGAKGATPQRLEAGDVLILPDGGAHLLYDDSGSDDSGGMPSPVRSRDGINMVVHENDGTGRRLDMLCGRFELSLPHIHLLRSYLPPRLIVRCKDDNAQLSNLIRMMREEVAAENLGGRALLNAFSAALFAISLRSTHDAPDAHAGLLALVKHPRLAPALTVLLNQPSQPWTMPMLADLCHMSRATFARHFQESLGRSAADLLTDIRMTLAANELKAAGASTASAARSAGYQSEAAFQRVFKERLGVTPAQWRRKSKEVGKTA